MGTTVSLQIAALAVILIVGGLSGLKLASIRLDKRYPSEPPQRD
ncbi:hypothetical protein [uncultured Methylobacterium sp.]